MPETLICQRNLAFELYEVLDAEALTRRERFAEHSRETFDAALGTARTIAEKYFAPHNRKSDEHEPGYQHGEAVLHGHPAVRDCAVFGVPDGINGEAVVAAVVAGEPVDPEELRAQVADRLASYKTPHRIEFVTEIPRLPSGKALRRVLKEDHGCPSDA